MANNLSGALHSLPWTPHAPIPVAEAVAFIRAQYGTVVEREDVAVGAAIGRVLARDLVAPMDLPRFDASAVDGYAIRAQDRGVPLKIVGRSAAGHPINVVLGAGEAVRIFTGAAVPAGADMVVMQEDCAVDGATLKVLGQGSDRRNIRRRGEDRRKGDITLAAGRRIAAGQLALAAALGFATLPVYRPLKVALFSSGDEVHSREPDSAAAGAIVDANRPLLGALLAAAGCAVEDRGILRDAPAAQIAALMAAARDCDLIVTSGGMSVGDEDHLPHVIARRGRLEVWRLKIKPGKPVGIGDIDDCPILALPGNPVAAALTFLLIGRVLIARLSGVDAIEAVPTMRLILDTPIEKRRGRLEAVAAKLVDRAPLPTAVRPLAKTGSAMLSALAEADGFIVLGEDSDGVTAGSTVEFLAMPRL